MIIWSLFDGSGYAALPHARAGHTVLCFNADEGDHGSYSKYACRVIHPNIVYINLWLDIDFRYEAYTMLYGNPALIMAFPPCTDLANSGSRAWADKRKRNPLFQILAAQTAKLGAYVAEMIGCAYMVENPVGRLSTLWRKPDEIFQPWEYGAYLPSDDIHPHFPEFIAPRDAYPKTTCLWTGGGFVMPARKPVQPDTDDNGYSDQYNRLGGKSARTKIIRSLTPRGFANAVHDVN